MLYHASMKAEEKRKLVSKYQHEKHITPSHIVCRQAQYLVALHNLHVSASVQQNLQLAVKLACRSCPFPLQVQACYAVHVCWTDFPCPHGLQMAWILYRSRMQM